MYISDNQSSVRWVRKSLWSLKVGRGFCSVGEKIPLEPESRKRKRAADDEVVLPVVSEASKERRIMVFFLILCQ
jgi:hypothetical protein